MQKPRHFDLLLAIAFIALNFVLKFIFINSRDIAMDEPFTIWWSQQGFGAIFNILKVGNDSALHYVFLHYWIQLFGISPMSVRLPSVIFSACTAGIIYYTGAKHFSRKAGVLAAMIFTFSTMQVTFAHEARIYALFELLAAWNILLCLSIAKNPGSRRLFIWLFICDVLLVYAHYLGWMVIGMQVIILSLLAERKMIWKSLQIVLLLLLISYFPNFSILFSRIGSFSSGTWVHRPHITELYGNINRFLNSRLVTLILILIIVTGAIMAFVKRKASELAAKLRNDQSFRTVFLWFFLPYLLMFAISFRFPMFLDRYILFTTPSLYLLIAIFFELIPVRKWLYYLFPVLLLASMLMFYNLNPDNNRRVAELASKVKNLRKSNDIVLISPEYASLEFAYYYDLDAFCNYNTTTKRLNDDNIFPLRTLQQLPKGIIDSAKNIIYVDCGSAFAFGEDIVGHKLKQKFIQNDSVSVYAIYTIRQFGRK